MEVICNKKTQNCLGCSHSEPHTHRHKCIGSCSLFDGETNCISFVVYQRKIKLEKLESQKISLPSPD